MKKYIILNGDKLFIKEFKTLNEATVWAQDWMNHSNEVIVREFKEFNVNKSLLAKLFNLIKY